MKTVFPNYQATLTKLWEVAKPGIRLNLEAIRSLSSSLGDPWKSYPCVLVAGTNGKGSTVAMLSEILHRSGYRVGVYTSPHLSSYRERIVIKESGAAFDEICWCNNFLKIMKKVEALKLSLTQFEILTALAFLIFQEKKVDVAILEIGMGGRLDATNAVEPILSVITAIDYDHCEFLGHTLPEIVREKAGILRAETPAVAGIQAPEVMSALFAEAEKIHSRLQFTQSATLITSTLENLVFDYKGQHFKLSLRGGHQVQNASVAIEAARCLRNLGYSIPETAIADGLKNTQWPGRIEILSHNPTLILDGAHNPQGAKNLCHFLTSNPFEPPHYFVIGILDTKDAKSILESLKPWGNEWIFCQSRDPKAIPSESLGALAQSSSSRRLREVRRVGEACRLALTELQGKGTLCVTGSLTTVGEARRLLKGTLLGMSPSEIKF